MTLRNFVYTGFLVALLGADIWSMDMQNNISDAQIQVEATHPENPAELTHDKTEIAQELNKLDQQTAAPIPAATEQIAPEMPSYEMSESPSKTDSQYECNYLVSCEPCAVTCAPACPRRIIRPPFCKKRIERPCAPECRPICAPLPRPTYCPAPLPVPCPPPRPRCCKLRRYCCPRPMKHCPRPVYCSPVPSVCPMPAVICPAPHPGYCYKPEVCQPMCASPENLITYKYEAEIMPPNQRILVARHVQNAADRAGQTIVTKTKTTEKKTLAQATPSSLDEAPSRRLEQIVA